MVAEKLCTDGYYRNTDYAVVGGVPSEELNALEREVMSLLDYNLFISEDVYSNYKNQLTYFAANIQSCGPLTPAPIDPPQRNYH